MGNTLKLQVNGLTPYWAPEESSLPASALFLRGLDVLHDSLLVSVQTRYGNINSQHELTWMYMHAGDSNNTVPLVCVQDSVLIKSLLVYKP